MWVWLLISNSPSLLESESLVLAHLPPSTLYSQEKRGHYLNQEFTTASQTTHTSLSHVSPTVFLAPDFHGSGQMTLPSFFSPETKERKGKRHLEARLPLQNTLTILAHHLFNATS